MKIPLYGSMLTVAAVALVGCSQQNPDWVSYESISDNLTPELQTLTERPIDVDVNMAVAGNQTWRMIWEDMGRAWYSDHPSRLTPYPITYTSGKPR